MNKTWFARITVALLLFVASAAGADPTTSGGGGIGKVLAPITLSPNLK